VKSKTDEYRRRVFRNIADNVAKWQYFLKCEKGIYAAMNLFNWDVTSKCLIAEGWCPTSDLPKINQTLQHAMVIDCLIINLYDFLFLSLFWLFVLSKQFFVCGLI